MENKKAMLDAIWMAIQHFQDAREEDDACEDREEWSDRVLSYNDVENELYDVLENIDPSVKTVRASPPSPAIEGKEEDGTIPGEKWLEQHYAKNPNWDQEKAKRDEALKFRFTDEQVAEHISEIHAPLPEVGWQNDGVNILLANAMKYLSPEQMIALADALYERNPHPPIHPTSRSGRRGGDTGGDNGMD